MKYLIKQIFLVLILFAAGCSSKGAGNATFTMTLSGTTVVAGGSVSSTSQLTSTASSPVNNIDITYTSNRPDLIHFAGNTATNYGGSSIAVKTNSTGNAYVVLNIDNSVAIPAEGTTVSITASSSGLTSTQQLTVTALPSGGGAVVGTSKISLVLGATSILDNGGQTIATATVTDPAGTPLSGQTVSFSFSPATGPATIVPINGGVTDNNGNAYATVTGSTTSTAQNIFIYATVSGVQTAKPLTVNPSSITTPSSIPKSVTLALTKAQFSSAEQTILTATVTDGSNIPVANQTVSFSLSPVVTHASITPINSGLTDSSGKAYAVITGGVATSTEIAVVYASSGVSPNVVTSSTTLNILPPGATSSTLPAAKISMVSDKTSLVPVTGQALITTIVTDSAGAVVPGTGVTFTVLSGPLTIITPVGTATTDSSGKVMAVVQASASANPTYALINATTTNGTSQTISLIIAPTGKPQLTLSISKPIIDSTDKEVLATVQVLDVDGNPVAGQSVSFANVSGPFTINAALTTGITGIDGNFTTKLIPTAAAFSSNALLSVQLTYQGTVYTLVATAVVNPAVNLSVVLDSATVDAVGQIVATATATSSSGVPLPSQVVTYTITGPGTIVGSSTTTAADGTSKAVITHDASTAIGNIIVEASITYGGTTYSAYATAIPKVANMKLTLSVQSGFTPTYTIGGPLGTLTDATTTTVDGLTAGLPIKANLTYNDGTPVPNRTITFTALDPGVFWNSAGAVAVANGPTVTATTSTSGDAYVVAVLGTFNTSGFIHIQASAVINGITYTQVMPIAVQATQIQKSLTLDKSALVISPNESAKVSGTYSLKNSSGTAISAQNVTFSILSGPATLVGTATVATDGAGNASVFIQAGPSITARETVYVNAAVTINGNTYNTVSSFTVDPSIKLALVTDIARVDANNGQVVATATLTDSAGTAITGQQITFSILGGSASVTSAGSVSTSASGTANATIQTGNTNSTQNVLVQAATTYAGTTYTQVTSFQIARGTGILTLSTTASASSTIAADITAQTFFHQIPFTLTDSNGNPRPNVPVTLSVLSWLGSTATIGTPTVTSDAAGKGVFNTQTTVNVGTQGGISDSSVVFKAETNDANPVIAFGGEQYLVTRGLSALTLSPASVVFTGSSVTETSTIVVNQGVAPYTVSSSNASRVSAAIVGSSVTLTLQSVNWSGSETITVTDAKGQTAAATVTFAPTALAVSPSAVTVAIAANATITISGGITPYSVSNSNNATATVTVPTATTINVRGVASGSSTITVRDTAGTGVTVAVTVP